MEFDEFIGFETSEKEYKLGVICWKEEFDLETITECLRTCIWKFNECIINTIIEYIEKYLSKYIASFTHKLSNLKNGYLYIGVNDKGYVKGIPYKGSLSLDFLNPIIDYLFKNSLFFPNEEIKMQLRKHMMIETINVTYTKKEEKLFDFEEFMKTENKKRNKIERFESFKKRWNILMDSQGGKIHENLNKNRERFISYLEIKEILTKKKYKHMYSCLEYLCDVPTYYDLRADLKIKEYKELKRGNVCKCINITNFNNRGEVHISEFNDIISLYTFGRYWDYCRDNYRFFKPKIPKLKLIKDHPKKILSHISNMIPSWISKNEDINLYVIKIVIPSGFLKDGESIMYYNEKKRKYQECFRTVDVNNGPTTALI